MAENEKIPEMRPTFEEIKRISEDGEPFWSSRELCGAMGYSAYWKFSRVIDKAIKVAVEKGMDVDHHFNRAVEMVRLGSGAFRKVDLLHLSRMACMMIAENADSKKVLVQQARMYFSEAVPMLELIDNIQSSSILFYKSPQGETRIEVIFNSETFWMSQKRMATLFGVDVRTINYHLNQIYESGELTKSATIRKIGIVQTEGVRDVERTPLFYNLDAIIAVGYRVNSYQATQFRIWATSVLKEFIIKGFVLKAPDGRVQKSDTEIAKNYLSSDELSQLNGITTAFLDIAEARAQRHIVTTMAEWKERLTTFLASMDYSAISTSGSVSHKMAVDKAHQEYEKYRLIQDRTIQSDFDRYISDDDNLLLPFNINPQK